MVLRTSWRNKVETVTMQRWCWKIYAVIPEKYTVRSPYLVY